MTEKKKTTQKNIMRMCKNVISIPYSHAHHMLSLEDPQYYNAGNYGWNADVYIFGDTAIVTGYRSWGNIKPDYDMLERYEHAAFSIRDELWNDCESARAKLRNLIADFIGDCCK